MGDLDPSGPTADRLALPLHLRRRLIGEEGGALGSQLAEFLRTDSGPAHEAELVLDEGVADFDDLHEVGFSSVLEAGAHEALPLVALQALRGGILVTGLHLVLLGSLGGLLA